MLCVVLRGSKPGIIRDGSESWLPQVSGMQASVSPSVPTDSSHCCAPLPPPQEKGNVEQEVGVYSSGEIAAQSCCKKTVLFPICDTCQTSQGLRSFSSRPS